MTEPELHYYCAPDGDLSVDLPVRFLTVQEFLADEPACKALWDLIGANFRTRSKFLTVWPGVRYGRLWKEDISCMYHRLKCGSRIGVL